MREWTDCRSEVTEGLFRGKNTTVPYRCVAANCRNVLDLSKCIFVHNRTFLWRLNNHFMKTQQAKWEPTQVTFSGICQGAFCKDPTPKLRQGLWKCTPSRLQFYAVGSILSQFCPQAQIFWSHAAAKERRSDIHARYQKQKHLLFILMCSVVVLCFV